MLIEGRYQRQEDIVSQDMIRTFTPLIVGCGAIGSQVAIQLGQMGSDLNLCDFDTVDEANLGCQGFREEDLGRAKVDALADRLDGINSEIVVAEENGKFRKSMVEEGSVVFCCVDSIETRGFIFDACVKANVAFFIDGRMKGGDTIRIVQARQQDPDSFDYYPLTLFKSEEAQTGACTARTTIFGAYIAAALMVSEYARWLRGYNLYEKDYLLSLPATEMYPLDERRMADDLEEVRLLEEKEGAVAI